MHITQKYTKFDTCIISPRLTTVQHMGSASNVRSTFVVMCLTSDVGSDHVISIVVYTSQRRGGGGDSSGLDTIYPPTNCWPEDPSGEGLVWFGLASTRPVALSVPLDARPKAWGTKHSAASTPDLCTRGTLMVSLGSRRTQTLSVALHERPHNAGPLPELYPL